MNLEITQEQALQAFDQANADGKRLLVNLFGIAALSLKLTERIKTFEDVCLWMGEDSREYKTTATATPEENAAVCMKRLKLIAKAFNGEWRPDLADTKQYKYYPWFRINKDDSEGASGFGLSFHVCGCGNAITHLGARPYFKDADTATYVGKQFIEEYNQWINYENLSF